MSAALEALRVTLSNLRSLKYNAFATFATLDVWIAAVEAAITSAEAERAALVDLLEVSGEVWRAMVDHEGPPVLKGKVDVALRFVAAGNRARAALEGKL